MVKKRKAREKLEENMAGEQLLYELIGNNRKVTGEVALKYLTDNGISKKIAESIITKYGREELSVAGPPAGTEPTVIKKEDE